MRKVCKIVGALTTLAMVPGLTVSPAFAGPLAGPLVG